MARQFGTYSPRVPLGTTWEESIVLEDSEGQPVDLTGYAVVAQLYSVDPLRDPDTGAPIEAPVLEITTDAYHDTPPPYSVVGFDVPDPENGQILLALAPADFWHVAPTNERTDYVWGVMLINGVGYTIPVIRGSAKFLPNRVLL